MASILDFLNTSKASALFSKVSEKTGETNGNVETVFGTAFLLILGAIQKKIKTEEGGQEFYSALEDKQLDDEFLIDLNNFELEIYTSAGKKFLPHVMDSVEDMSKSLSVLLGVKEISVSNISQIAAGTLVHILSIQKSKEKLSVLNMPELISSNMGSSSKYDHSLISTILDKNEEGNIIQDVEGRIIGGGQNEKNKDGGLLGGMLGGK